MNKKETATIVTIVAMIAAVGAVTILTSTSLIQTANAQCETKGPPGATVIKCQFGDLRCHTVFTPGGPAKQTCHINP